MFRFLVTAGFAVVLVGCASAPVVDVKYDHYFPSTNTVVVQTATSLESAEVIAKRLCKGDAWEVPEAHQASLQKQQQQRIDGYRRLEPISWEFSCTPEGAWHIRWKVYGDEDSGKLYQEYEKVQRAAAAHNAEVEYQRLRELAKQKGVTSESRVLRDGSIISESYGNGRLCTGVSDEFGSRMSCEEVR